MLIGVGYISYATLMVCPHLANNSESRIICWSFFFSVWRQVHNKDNELFIFHINVPVWFTFPSPNYWMSQTGYDWEIKEKKKQSLWRKPSHKMKTYMWCCLLCKYKLQLTCSVTSRGDTWRDDGHSGRNAARCKSGPWVRGGIGFGGRGADRYHATGGILWVRLLLAAVVLRWVGWTPGWAKVSK